MRLTTLGTLACVLVLGFIGCASPSRAIGKWAPPLLSPDVERGAEIIRRGRLGCSPHDAAFSTNFWLSGNGRILAIHTQCYRGGTYRGDFIDLIDLERDRRVAQIPYPLRHIGRDLELRFVAGDERLQLALPISTAAAGNYATRLQLMEFSTETGEILQDLSLLLDEGLPSAKMDWTERGLFVIAYDSPSEPQLADRFYAVEWPAGAEPSIVETLESTQLTNLAYPESLVPANITTLPGRGGLFTALVESQGVMLEPSGITHTDRSQGWGHHDGYGRFVLELTRAAEADVIEQWPGYAVSSGVAVRGISPDGRYLAVGRGGFVQGEREPQHCAAHVRRADGFEVVGRLPCAFENRDGDIIEYRTLEIFFSRDSRTFAAVRGNGGFLDLFSLEPWQQTHRIAASDLGVRSITAALAHPQPNTYLIIGGRDWLLVQVN